MASISPETLATELRLRQKSQNYGGIDDAISKAINETSAARNAAGGNALGEIRRFDFHARDLFWMPILARGET